MSDRRTRLEAEQQFSGVRGPSVATGSRSWNRCTSPAVLHLLKPSVVLLLGGLRSGIEVAVA